MHLEWLVSLSFLFFLSLLHSLKSSFTNLKQQSNFIHFLVTLLDFHCQSTFLINSIVSFNFCFWSWGGLMMHFLRFFLLFTFSPFLAGIYCFVPIRIGRISHLKLKRIALLVYPLSFLPFPFSYFTSLNFTLLVDSALFSLHSEKILQFTLGCASGTTMVIWKGIFLEGTLDLLRR